LIHGRGSSQENIELLEVPAVATGEEKRAPWSNAREFGELIKQLKSYFILAIDN